jgi:N-[(2S)-2-amino-2-carboxyethyl]-L-glutamate dehydrogenase
MRYISGKDIGNLHIEWDDLINVIANACHAIRQHDYSQPIKNYLRYGDLRNRIIAMPAFVGGPQPQSGIKWIASFPGNLKNGIPRAHSVTILNDPFTGVPTAIINSAKVSILRTAAVSAALVDQYVKARRPSALNVGIIGYGPIGQMHASMLRSVAGTRISSISVYDVATDQVYKKFPDDGLKFCSSWMECYSNADILITATVSSGGYIDLPPKKGSLQLNVSLRDYMPVVREFMDVIVVDDWDEVCRENTDIEAMYKDGKLKSGDVIRFDEVIASSLLNNTDINSTIMFNPMGMAVFDVAVGAFIGRLAEAANLGVLLSSE